LDPIIHWGGPEVLRPPPAKHSLRGRDTQNLATLQLPLTSHLITGDPDVCDRHSPEQEGQVVTHLAQSSLRPLSTRATMSHHARTTPTERRPAAALSGSSSLARSHQTCVIWHMLALEFLLPVTKCFTDNLITIAVQGDNVSIPFDFFCEDGAPFANVTPRIAIPSRGVPCRNLRKFADIYLEQPVSIEKHHCVRPQIYTLQDLRC
jgi:hypothetical protein